MTDKLRHERLLDFIIRYGYQRSSEAFTLASGAKSHFYFNIKRVLMKKEGLSLITNWALTQSVFDTDITHVGGMELGAVPFASALSIQSPHDLDSFIVRKKTKGYGANQEIEGDLNSQSNVIVVEDVITSGGSTLKAIEAVEACGAKVRSVIAIIDRDCDRKEDLLSKYIVQSAFKLSEIQKRLP